MSALSHVLSRVIHAFDVGGIKYLGEASILWFFETLFFYKKKSKIFLEDVAWKEIDFEALNLPGARAKIPLNPYDEGFSKEFACFGFREPLNTFCIFKFVERMRPVVLDVGSNLGYFPVIEIQAGARHVVAVEPVPLTFALLSRVLKDLENVTLLNAAVSDRYGKLKMYIPENFNAATVLKEPLIKCNFANIEEITVEAIPISAIVEKYPVNMIRMDVEGYEYIILGGDIPDQIKAIAIEFHVSSKIRFIRFIQHLDDHSFSNVLLINEMPFGYYPLVKRFGLGKTYKFAEWFRGSRRAGIRHKRTAVWVKELEKRKTLWATHAIFYKDDIVGEGLECYLT